MKKERLDQLMRSVQQMDEAVHAAKGAPPPAPVGDLSSQEKGSGARFNAGKVPYELLPLKLLTDYLDAHELNMGSARERSVLRHMGEWQAGRDDALDDAIMEMTGVGWGMGIFADAARVLGYGRYKYAEWNWAKGMPWSVPLGCIVRHVLQLVLHMEELDQESGLPHAGHIMCNLIMLKLYAETYPEGDDRPVKWLSKEKGA